MNWKGKVVKVSTRDWGTKTIHSWQLAGTPQWFRADKDPGIVEGECYSFSGETAQKIYITTIKPLGEEELKEAAKEQLADAGGVPPSSSPDYWRWKQMRDLSLEKQFKWRDARHDAARIVCAALDNDALSLGSKKQLKLGLIVGYVNEVTTSLLKEMEDAG